MEKNKMAKTKEKLSLSETKVEQLNRQPIVETVITKSENGLWVTHKTIITDIKPVRYYEMVLNRNKK